MNAAWIWLALVLSASWTVHVQKSVHLPLFQLFRPHRPRQAFQYSQRCTGKGWGISLWKRDVCQPQKIFIPLLKLEDIFKAVVWTESLFNVAPPPPPVSLPKPQSNLPSGAKSNAQITEAFNEGSMLSLLGDADSLQQQVYISGEMCTGDKNTSHNKNYSLCLSLVLWIGWALEPKNTGMTTCLVTSHALQYL